MRRAPLALSIALLPLAALAGVPHLVRARGWAPMVALGGGSPAEAVSRLDLGLDVLEALVARRSLATETATFVDDLRARLGELDLPALYQLLPEQSGDWRRFRLVGAPEGRRYRLGPPPAASARPDPRAGELSFEVAARPVPARESYLTHLQLDLGTGAVGFQQLLSGLSATALLLGSGDPGAPHRVQDPSQRPGAEARLQVLEAFPGLRAEDVEPLAVLWEAQPALWDELRQVLRVEDVLIWDPSGRARAQQLRLRARLEPDRLEARFPDLAEFLRGLGPILRGQVQWFDLRGRPVLRVGFDTASLSLTLEGFVAGGGLVPVENGWPVLDEAASGPRAWVGVADTQLDFNGIQTRIRGMTWQTAWCPDGEGAELRLAARTVPSVEVSGRALGILPTWAIDVLIPGDLEQLTREFLVTALEGNEGRGVVARLAAGGAAQDERRWQAGLDLELPDSALIRFGFQLAQRKLLPGPEAREDVARLLEGLCRAFRQDLRAYARDVAGAEPR